MMAAVVARVSAAIVPAMSGVVGVGRRDVVMMPLGPRGVPAGHGAVPVRRITVPGAR
jgi:hypothetical protein